jgi:predicted lipopolysaccharide heptosyltransferase III
VNILLIQLKRIGDLILTTPAIAALRQEFPEANLTLVITQECAELAPAINGVDRILIMPRGLSGLETFAALARTKFDYCIDFTRNDRSAFLSFLSRAQKRIVSFGVKKRSTLRARAYNEFVQHRMRDRHTVDYHLSLLEPLGISTTSSGIHLQLPARPREKADELRRIHGIADQFIIFHPGSARVEKLWDTQGWTEVIDHAGQNYNADLVLTGGKSELEQTHLAKIQSKARKSVTDLSGQTDLLTLAALIGHARLLITVDSAPMHLAAATRTPQVILFGPTNPFHWRPRESPALILQGGSTSPLSEFSSKTPRLPMKQISTRAVIDAMESLLSIPAGQGS